VIRVTRVAIRALRSNGGSLAIAKTKEGPLAGKTRLVLDVDLKSHQIGALVIARFIDGPFASSGAYFENQHGFVRPCAGPEERAIVFRLNEYVIEHMVVAAHGSAVTHVKARSEVHPLAIVFGQAKLTVGGVHRSGGWSGILADSGDAKYNCAAEKSKKRFGIHEQIVHRDLPEGQTVCCSGQAIPCIFAVWACCESMMLEMSKTQTGARSPQWYWISVFWFSLGLFDATQTVVAMRAQGMQHAWTALFFTLLLCWLPWALATPLILLLGNRYPLLPARSFTNWAFHSAGLVLLAVISAAWSAFLERLLNPWTPTLPPSAFLDLWRNKSYSQLLSSLIFYGCILLVGYMLESRERLAQQKLQAAQLSEQLTKAQLNALRHQIEPHFLFNSLNAVAGLIREGNDDGAVDMIARLSDFLRHSLQDNERQEVPLGEELEFVQKYLDIQKVRFAERLQVRIDLIPGLFEARVPSLILQPVVENAVKHGIAKRAQGGGIEISATRLNGTLTLSVFNDGPCLTEDWDAKRAAIGLSNVRERLNSLYGRDSDLKVANEGTRGVRVSISVPFRVE
jgi:two-component system, LytTR family, sensor kinase